MAFPSNPTNNQLTTVNNISYYYNSTKGAWIRSAISTTGSNDIVVNTVTATGNIQATYFVGNGSLLTGIVGGSGTTYSNTNVSAYLTTYTGTFGNLTGGITSSGTIQTTGNVQANGFMYANGLSILDPVYSNAAIQAGQISSVNSNIGIANTAMKGYVDSTVSSNISTVNTSISTANTAMKGYVDSAVSSKINTSTANTATPAINTDSCNMFIITGQSVAITSFSTNLTGAPVNGQKLWIAITGTTAVAITWGASFEASTVSLPTTTTGTTRLDVGFVYNSATSKWRCVASA